VAKPAILLAGPTGSGKSALALALAEQFDGEIINADSMQVYRDLRVLTARPSSADEARVPHHLYGVLDADQRCSAGRWLDLAGTALETIWAANKVPIFVGGTGLYLRALTDGLAPTPDIPLDVRAEADRLSAQLAPEAFHARLATVDSEMAARLHASDIQRISRAWQVIAATGVSLADWQEHSPSNPLVAGAEALRLVVNMPRKIIWARCHARFDAMIDAGALDEVRALLDQDLDPSLPAMKALGVPQLGAYLAGTETLENAIELAKVATRQYVKRQSTWFRNQTTGWNQINAQDSKSFLNEIVPIIRKFGLTT
jgi:tRNA dimethylallyltransferase